MTRPPHHQDDIIRISVNPPEEESSAAKGKPKRLGKGLGALLGETRREQPVRSAEETAEGGTLADGQSAEGEGLRELPVASIEPHPEQPRRVFAEDALAELAASIEARGVIQPLIVRPLAGGRYQLVAGERRWRAAQKARLHAIPAVVRELEDVDVFALALIENIQREDLNPIEEARAYQRLADQQGMTQAEIARLVEKSRSHVANLQRLLALPESVVDMVEEGKLSMGHARALIGQDDAEKLALTAIRKGLNVRQVEDLVRGRDQDGDGGAQNTSPGRKRGEPRQLDPDIAAVQSHLEEFLGLPVRIAPDADPRAGAVTIRYRTLDQLDLVCQRLTGGEI